MPQPAKRIDTKTHGELKPDPTSDAGGNPGDAASQDATGAATLEPVDWGIPGPEKATAKGRTRVRMYPNKAEFLAPTLGISGVAKVAELEIKKA